MNNLLKWWGANTVYAFIRYDLTLFWQNPDEQGKQASPDTNEQIVSKQFALSCSSCSPSLSGVWMHWGDGRLPNKCSPYDVLKGGWHSCISEAIQRKAKDSWIGTTWPVAMWTPFFAFILKQLIVTTSVANPRLLWLISKVAIWLQVCVLVVWAEGVC